MADFNEPTNVCHYNYVLGKLKDTINSVAKMFNGTSDINLPDGTVKWNATTKRFEIYDAANDSWGPLTDIYQITVANASNAVNATNADTAASCSGSVANAVYAATAGDAETLDGLDSSAFCKGDDTRLSDERQCDNTFDDASTARSNLSVHSIAQVNDLFSAILEGNPTFQGDPTFQGNPNFSGLPTSSNILENTDSSTRIATSNFVQRAIHRGRGDYAFSSDPLNNPNVFIWREKGPSNFCIQVGYESDLASTGGGNMESKVFFHYPFSDSPFVFWQGIGDMYPGHDRWSKTTKDIATDSFIAATNSHTWSQGIVWLAFGRCTATLPSPS